MNEFRSPHQNININISYNLGNQQKIPKVIFASKNAKINKFTLAEEEAQALHKNGKKVNTEPSVAKETKDNKKSKSTKLKKKINNFVEPNALRIKTEGNVSSAPKHDLKTSLKPFFKQNNQHNKSVNNPSMNLVPKALILKKQTEVIKAKKEENRNYNKSCIIYPKKHIFLSDVEHIVSTTTSGPVHTNKNNKKRVNSVNLIRGDKFINKLLDMSVLTSELGGTVPIHDETNKRQDFGLNKMKKSLHEFMNSVDLRIIKKMEQDQQKKGILTDLKVGEGMELITFLQRIRRIPIDTLHLKASKIQKFWRRISSQNIVPYYSNMFFRNPMINAKAFNNNNIEEISHIDVEEGSNYREDEKNSFIKSSVEAKIPEREKFELSSIGSSDREVLEASSKLSELFATRRAEQNLNVEEMNEKELSYDESNKRELKEEIDEHNVNDEKEDELANLNMEEYEYENNNKNSKSLNIQKYKELVRETIQKSKQDQQKIYKQTQFRSDQVVELVANNQVLADSQSIDRDIPNKAISSNISKKVPTIPNNVMENLMSESAINKELIEREFNNPDSRKEREEKKNEIVLVNQIEKNPNIYEKEYKSEVEASENNDLMEKVKGCEFYENLYEMDKEESQNELDKDSKEMKIRRIDEEGIVENYLDCGLSSFGLSIHGSINHEQFLEKNKNETEFEEEECHQSKLEKVKHLNTKEEYAIKNNDNISYQELLVSQNKNKRIEVATKNRNDTINHLGYRTEQNFEPNINEFADIGVTKKEHFIGDETQHEDDECLMEKVNKKLMESALIEQESQKITLFPQIDILQEDEYFTEQTEVEDELKKSKVSKIIEAIISKLIHDFAQDVSLILRKSQANGMLSIDNEKKNNFNKEKNDLVASNSSIGVQTTFQSIRDFITKLKEHVLDSDEFSNKMLENLRNNIGPTSMEILSYLRIDDEGDLLEEDEEEENDEWLFVIPNNLFEDFNKKLIEQEEVNRGKKLSNRFKLYIEFWHRSIFECFNECLDYERPYGITGAPYVWVTEPKLPHKIHSTKKKTKQILENAESRLLEISCCSSGIIFDKQDSPYREFNLSEENKTQLNEEKISRMLASEILDDEYNWIIYNDEMTELMVDISRKIEDLLVFQVSSEIKKICKLRKDIGMLENKECKNENNEKEER